ncbi:MAG: penicillin-binding protein activator [Desulfatirhabdiaceae bacterium]
MSSIRLHTGILLLSIFVLLSSCAPKKIISTERPPEKPPVVRPAPEVKMDMGDDLFTSAEKLYQNKQIDAALEAYQVYLDRYPDGSWVPDSLFRIGQIHLEQGKPAQALNAFQRLASEYPKSAMGIDAELAALQIYYQMKNYNGVIQRARDLLNRPLPSETSSQINGILGEALFSVGKTQDAMMIWDQAMNQASAEGQSLILNKIDHAAAQISSNNLLRLSNSLGNIRLQGELVYLAALQQVEREDYDQADGILDAFRKRFPEHDRISAVQQISDRIQRQSQFSHQTIGCLLPLTGQYETYGKKALKGLEMAQFLFSQSGTGPPVAILIRDTESRTEKAAELVAELAQEGVAAILGPIGSAESAAQAAQENQIPIVTLTQKEKITQIGSYVFRHYMTPEIQAETLISFAVQKLGLSRFGVLYPKDNYGTSFMNIFWDRVLAHGGTMVGAEGYDPAATDFMEPIQKLSGAYYSVQNMNKTAQSGADLDIQALFIPDSPVKAAMIIPQIVFYDLNQLYIFGPNMWHTPTLFQASDLLTQGLIFADAFFPESDREPVKAFVHQFKEGYGEAPGFLEAITYDSAMMLFSAISYPNLKYRSDIRKALLNMPEMDGVTGPTRFSSERDAHKKLVLLQIKGGQFIETAID